MSKRHSDTFGQGILSDTEIDYPSDPPRTYDPPDDALPGESHENHRVSEHRVSEHRDTEPARHPRRPRGKKGVKRKKGYRKRVSHINPQSGNETSTTTLTGKHGEPLCLAELLAYERSKGLVEPDYDKAYEQFRKQGDSTYYTELQKMSMKELLEEARRYQQCIDADSVSRQDLIVLAIHHRVKQNGLMFGEGTLEILPDSFGFLRSTDYNYISSLDDIYISPSQIRRFGLRQGSVVSGQIRPPKESERYFALLRVEAINYEDPNLLNEKPHFDELTPVYPNQQIQLTYPESSLDMAIMNLMIPIGFGQRGLLFSPPLAGATTMFSKMAQAVCKNYPEAYVFLLLLDERPEEATIMTRKLRRERCEVVCTLFDEPPTSHIHAAEIVLEKAKRLVEYGHNVLIFLDSVTKLAKAWNTATTEDGKQIIERPDSLNLQPVKKFFSSARKAEEGGSLTILTSVAIETGNAADAQIFEAFKGTGNMEVWLDRDLADRRIWPSINIHKSGTRNEDLLLQREELRRNSSFRRELNNKRPDEAIDFLRQQLEQSTE